MAYTDLNHTNGWVQEEAGSEVLTTVNRLSAVEAGGRKIRMNSDAMILPTGLVTGVDVVAEGATIPLLDPTLGNAVMTAVKWANRFAQSVEDEQDSIVDFFNFSKNAWFSNWAVEFDNAALGVTSGTVNGTTVPFQSVYSAVGSGGRIQTAGALTYEDLNTTFNALEGGNYYDPANTVVIAHPSLQGSLRNLKDEDGLRVVSDPLGAGTPTIFGNQLIFSAGARTSATATDNPSGNPLLIVGSRDNLLVGVRSGPEYMVSDAPQWENDVLELKCRVRRGFKVANAAAFRVVEITAGA